MHIGAKNIYFAEAVGVRLQEILVFGALVLPDWEDIWENYFLYLYNNAKVITLIRCFQVKA